MLFVLLCGPTTLEDELEGELHLPAPLFAYVAPEIVRIVNVAIRGRTIHAIQHVVSREPKLNIKRFADCGNREVLEERSVPVKLWPPTENVAARSQCWGSLLLMWASRIPRENSRR